MVRSLALFGETAYDSVLINGMVFGNDGRMMSKSLGNYVSTPEVFNKYGADASRQWAAAGGSTGTDIPFRWEDVEYGWRFQRKLWNACRFASMRLEDYNPSETVELELIDKWILSKLEGTVKYCTEAMENCDFMNATENARNFVWHVFCDHWLETAKTRLYGEGEEKVSAQYTMYRAVERMLKLLSPIMPHSTEEIYRTMYVDSSIHISEWPKYDESYINPKAEQAGEMIIATISEIRREKNRKGVSLNAEIEKVTVYATEEQLKTLNLGEKDIIDTLKIKDLEFTTGEGESKLEEYPEISFTMTL